MVGLLTKQNTALGYHVAKQIKYRFAGNKERLTHNIKNLSFFGTFGSSWLEVSFQKCIACNSTIETVGKYMGERNTIILPQQLAGRDYQAQD
jgi:hypothetical protein